MVSAFVAVILSFAVVTAVTPLIGRVATRVGVVDRPGGRHVHKVPTPRLGGIAVMLGFFTPLALFTLLRTGAMQSFFDRPELVLGLVVGSLVVGVVGAVDDVRGLGPWAKLAAEALAAVIAYGFGYRIDGVSVPFLGELSMGWFAVPVTVFWFLAITNAINLIDGLDGLAAGIAFFATLCNFVIACPSTSTVVVLLSASLGGALLGFLRYNFNPASIFLGDAGSMFIGFTLAATSLAGATTKSSTAVAIIVPVLALGVPLMDTTVAMVRRAVARQSIFAADRGHIHHRLLDLGLTHRRVVITLYGVSVTLVIAALAIAFGRSWHVGLSLAAVGVMAFGVVRLLILGSRAQAGADSLVSALERELGTATAKIAEVAGELDVELVLRELNGTTFTLLDADLARGQSELSNAGQRLFSYELRAGERTRLLQLRPRHGLEVADEKLIGPFAGLAGACEEALTRPVVREARATMPAQLVTHGPATSSES